MLKRCESLDIDQIPTELIQAEGNTHILRSEIHRLVNSIWNKEYLPQQWKEYLILPIYWGHQCGFLRDRFPIDQIFCIFQILGKEWEHNGTVHQLFIDSEKAYDSVRE
jgi:hypothetical protein